MKKKSRGSNRSRGKAVSSKKTEQNTATHSRRHAMQDALEKAAKGLTLQSESDFPYLFFSLPAYNDGALTKDAFLQAFGLSLGDIRDSSKQYIEERPLDDWFPSLEDIAEGHGTHNTNDPRVVAESKKYRHLETVLKKRLSDVKVFRIGEGYVNCFVAGIYGDSIAGLKSIAIET